MERSNFPIVSNNNKLFDDTNISDHRYDSNFLRCRPIKLNPSLAQRKILCKWFDIYRWAYNCAIKHFRQEHDQIISFMDLRKLMSQKYKTQIDSYIKQYGIPKHTIDNAYKDVLKAYKTAFANLKAKNIKYFRLRYKKATKSVQTLCLEKSAFCRNGGSFASKTLGKRINTNTPIPVVHHDCRLSLNVRTGKIILWLPINVDKIVREYRDDVCSLDPGIRTFQTMYDTERTCDFGSIEPKQIASLLKRIDLVKPRSKSKKFVQRLRDRIIHIVDDLHWKTALILVRNYNTILVGNMSTIGIVNNTRSVLTAMTKRIAYSLSHYRFRERLHSKAEQYGATVVDVDERYTSKTCGSCESKHPNLGGSKIYKCPKENCNFEWGRDQNGARNIMLKHFGLFNPLN